MLENTQKKSGSGCLIIIIIFLLFYIDGLEQKARKPQPITDIEITERIQNVRAYIAVLQAIDYYKAGDNNNGYNQNSDHLLKVWGFCEAYAPIITESCWIDQLQRTEAYKAKLRAEMKAIDVPLFIFCLCSDESAFKPDALHINKNKTHDNGITQINQDCQAEINAGMQTTDLKDRPWTDTEKNIVGRYIWIMTRAKDGMAWDLMTRQRGWKLYGLISNKIKSFKLASGGNNGHN